MVTSWFIIGSNPIRPSKRGFIIPFKIICLLGWESLKVFIFFYVAHIYSRNSIDKLSSYCISCDYIGDADINASINIHNRGIYSSSNKQSIKYE